MHGSTSLTLRFPTLRRDSPYRSPDQAHTGHGFSARPINLAAFGGATLPRACAFPHVVEHRSPIGYRLLSAARMPRPSPADRTQTTDNVLLITNAVEEVFFLLSKIEPEFNEGAAAAGHVSHG